MRTQNQTRRLERKGHHTLKELDILSAALTANKKGGEGVGLIESVSVRNTLKDLTKEKGFKELGGYIFSNERMTSEEKQLACRDLVIEKMKALGLPERKRMMLELVAADFDFSEEKFAEQVRALLLNEINIQKNAEKLADSSEKERVAIETRSSVKGILALDYPLGKGGLFEVHSDLIDSKLAHKLQIRPGVGRPNTLAEGMALDNPFHLEALSKMTSKEPSLMNIYNRQIVKTELDNGLNEWRYLDTIERLEVKGDSYSHPDRQRFLDESQSTKDRLKSVKRFMLNGLIPGLSSLKALHNGELDQNGNLHQFRHGDIKPENFLYAKRSNEDYRVILGDYDTVVKSGIQLDSKEVFGTLPYMSPEQFSYDEKINKKSDIYSLAVSIYHLLGGKISTKMSPHQAYMNSVNQDRLKFETMVIQNPRLNALLRKMISVEAEDRPSIDEVIFQLDDIFSELNDSHIEEGGYEDASDLVIESKMEPLFSNSEVSRVIGSLRKINKKEEGQMDAQANIKTGSLSPKRPLDEPLPMADLKNIGSYSIAEYEKDNLANLPGTIEQKESKKTKFNLLGKVESFIKRGVRRIRPQTITLADTNLVRQNYLTIELYEKFAQSERVTRDELKLLIESINWVGLIDLARQSSKESGQPVKEIVLRSALKFWGQIMGANKRKLKKLSYELRGYVAKKIRDQRV